MRNDHVCAEQFLTICKFLYEIFPVVDRHLQIEYRHVPAGAAGTCGVVLHLFERGRKDDVEVFHCLEQALLLHEVCLGHVHENGIPSKTRDDERMFYGLDLCVEETLQNLLSMIELRAGQVFRVTGNVGDDEKSLQCHCCVCILYNAGDMTRVLYTAFDIVPSPKGASTHILHNLRGLVNGKFDTHLLTPSDGMLPLEDAIAGAQVTRVSQDLTQNFLARAVHFGGAVQAHLALHPGYDVIHYRNIWDGLAIAQNKKKFGYKTLFEVNGLPSIELKYHYPGLDQELLTKIKEQEIATLHWSDAIICPSNVTKDYIASLGLDRKLVTVIPNGVSPSDFSPSSLPSRENRIPVLLYIGTLADWQGLDVLIKALPKILEHQAVRLHIVGRGRSRQRKMLAKHIRKLGVDEHVIVQPAVPHHEIPALIAAADICVAPLGLNDRNVTQGACPIKVLEYMAAGRPLLASNMPIVRELMREDVDGLLFSPNDPDDLARQGLSLLNDRALSERLSRSASERALTQFTWHESQKKLLKVYEKLLSN
jgi:glycosyltransferase involved in cell wall biosynthesis